MSFDAAVDSTYGGMLADLRDEVSGMTNWSLNEDSSGGASSLSKGEYFVLTSSAPAEDIYIGVESNMGAIVLQHGPNWDSGSSTWSDRYAYDPAQVGDFYDSDTSGLNEAAAVYLKTYDNNFPIDMSDDTRYWMEYVDGTGFGMYMQREVADGEDEDAFIGMARISRAWDYTSADAREAGWALGFGNSDTNSQRLIHMSASGNTDNNGNKSHAPGNNDYISPGLVNPDGNFDNYPATNMLVSSSQYRSVTGQDAIIGDFDIWIDDVSGSETGHKDLVQDNNSNNIYTILKRQDTPGLALRMD